MIAEATADDGALVLFSGGQDSSVCLVWALSRYERVETIGFDYGQRHAVELACRHAVLRAVRSANPLWDRRLGEDRVIDLQSFGALAESALTRQRPIEASEGLPSTFVPGRNLVFLSYAGAMAVQRGLSVLVGGMCETDYSGYPDCRRDTLDAMQDALSRGLDRTVRIATPLMQLSKAETWALAEDLGGEGFIQLLLEETHTCYLGQRGQRHPWGYGCGGCPACLLRARGWETYSAKASAP